MKMPLEEALSQSLGSPQQFLRIVVECNHTNGGRNLKAALQNVVGKCSRNSASALWEALADLATNSAHLLHQVSPLSSSDAAQEEDTTGLKSCRRTTANGSAKRRATRATRSSSPADAACEDMESLGEEGADGEEGKHPPQISLKSRKEVVGVLRACVMLAQISMSCQSSRIMENRGFVHLVKSLHDVLIFLEDAPDLQDAIARICEQCWREEVLGREALVAQSLPFLLSKSLSSNRKVDVHRVYLMRDAIQMFDFMDESSVDLKNLLMRCLVTPSYLRSADGQRFVSLLFGLNEQLVKDLASILFSQIPFGRKSILLAYSNILYRAWRVTEGTCHSEIEQSCLQRLIEGAVHASTKALAYSARKVLEVFMCQRAEEGVEGMLFRLHEPLLFRALQVANSNVRRNALLLLIDMFPLQDPESPKEEKEALLEKQLILLEKLLFDECPDIRSVAVEGVCRVLKLFWEIIPPANIVRLLSHVVNDLSKDQSSSNVRLAVLQGMTYLLDNPLSHPLLTALLPKLAPMLKDPALNVRLGVTDMLLAIKDVRSIKFFKVANLDSLLFSLATDDDAVAKRLTRLLIPSYFPSNLPVTEACNRCFALIKRSSEAGGRFCACALEGGVSAASLLELAITFCKLVQCGALTESKEQEGIILALAEICKSMACSKEGKLATEKVFTEGVLKSLLKVAATPRSRCSVMRLASLMCSRPVPELLHYCKAFVSDNRNTSYDLASHHEIKAVHTFLLASGGFDNLISSLMDPLRAFDFASAGPKADRTNEPAETSSQIKSGRKRMRKKTSFSKADRLGCISSSGGNLIAAARAAWQVEILLSQSETRKALLSCKLLPELLTYLRKLAQMTLTNFDGCKHLVRRIALSPVVAYWRLSVDLAFERNKLGKDHDTEISRKRQKQSNNANFTGHSARPLKSFDLVIEELLAWAGTFLATSSKWLNACASFQQEAKELSQLDNRKGSNKTPQTKKACSLSSKKARESGKHEKPQKEIPLNHISGVHVVRMVTGLLRSTVDAFELGLIMEKSVQSSCVRFTCTSISWMSAFTKLATSKDNTNAEETCLPSDALKELSGCLKASSSYAAKLMCICLRNSLGLALDLSELANYLFDLIACTEKQNTYGSSVVLLPTLKSWIPDLLIALTQNQVTWMGNEGSRTPRSKLDGDKTSLGGLLQEEDKQTLSRPWLYHLARLCFQSLLPSELLGTGSSSLEAEGEVKEEESNKSGVADSDLSMKKKVVSFGRLATNLMTTIVKAIRKGNPDIVVSFSIIILEFAGECVNQKNYSDALGSVDLVCRKILGHRLSTQQQWWAKGRMKNVLLEGLVDIYDRILSMQLEETSSSLSSVAIEVRLEDMQKLVLAKRLLKETIDSPCFQEINDL